MAASPATDDAYTVPAAERTVRILRFLKHRKRAGVSEIAAGLAISRSNCFGILKTLQQHGFVTFDEETKKYGLGYALLELGGSLMHDLDVIALAHPGVLKALQATGLSTFLVQRVSATRLMVIDKEETSAEIRLSIAIGMRLPITHGASGKCLLAHLPAEEAEALIASVGLPATTRKTVTDPARYRAELAQIRAQGYAVSCEESVEGANAIAAAVLDAAGRPILVLTSMGFTAALPARIMAEHGRTLSRIADEITAATGGRPPPRKG